MAIANYRGFNFKLANQSASVWKVKIKGQILTGNISELKKSIDWWCDTASVVDPQEFAIQNERYKKTKAQSRNEHYNGFLIKNDSDDEKAWYCMFNGRLIKGTKTAIQKHIDAYLVAKQKAEAGLKSN